MFLSTFSYYLSNLFQIFVFVWWVSEKKLNLLEYVHIFKYLFLSFSFESVFKAFDMLIVVFSY